MKRIPFLILFVLGFPLLSQAQQERVALRLISVPTEAEAANLRRQYQAGALFEALASAHSSDPSSSDGGYLGLVRPSDLRPELQRALEGLAAGQISAVTPIGGDYVLLQRMSVEETNWVVSQDAGLEAFRQDRYDEASEHFKQAVSYAEKLPAMVHHLEDSLHGLAEAYRSQRKYAEAEPVYRRYIAVRWGGPGVPELLDRFSTLLAMAYFRDSQFDATLRKFEEALASSSPDPEVYQAMAGILFNAELMPDAERLMVRAAQLLPQSKEVHYSLAQLYRDVGKIKKALEVFEQLTMMKAPASIDPAVERLQQSVVYQKIGSIQVELAEFDQAIAAYEKALQMTPDSAESRLGLGDALVQKGRPEDALKEYGRVIAADPRNAAAEFRIADVSLRLGRFPEAAAAAARVHAIDPAHRRAHYVQAMALVRMGRKEDGERTLDLYRKLEAEARSEADRNRTITVLNRSAAAKLLEGRPEEAVAMFLKLIESYPDAPSFRLNLGYVQSKLGNHKDALDTFQKMIDLRIGDNFLVHWNLAQEYQRLGDTDASRRHKVFYLQKIDTALESALESNLD